MRRHRQDDRGERGWLHKKGKTALLPGAIAAARVTFETCGGAHGWRSWATPPGKMLKFAYVVMVDYLDQNPNATAEDLFAYFIDYPHSIPPHDPRTGRIFANGPIAWDDAPIAVRAAYEAFRAVYRQLWQIVRSHDPTMAQALPWWPQPRLIHSADITQSPQGVEPTEASSAPRFSILDGGEQ
jgi:hypothetical protein